MRNRFKRSLIATGIAAATVGAVVTVSAGPLGRPDVEVARASHAWTAGSRRVVLRGVASGELCRRPGRDEARNGDSQRGGTRACSQTC